MVRARESPQLGKRAEDSCVDPANEKLFVCDQVIESAATDGKHPSGLYASYEELLIWGKCGAAWTFAFGDVHFFHNGLRWARGIVSPDTPHCLHSAWDIT